MRGVGLFRLRFLLQIAIDEFLQFAARHGADRAIDDLSVLEHMSVGIEVTWNFWAVSGFSSTLIFTITALPS